MHAWEQIQLTLDYIENHLTQDIKIEELSQIASLSQFYYQRLFSRLVKRPVNEYIKLRRLAKASDALLVRNNRILDIALDFGFTSHELFTRNFKNVYGMTPEEYRTHPVRLNNFCKPQLLLNYTLVDENVPLITEGIVIEISRRTLTSSETFIGLTTEEPIEQIPGNGEPGIDGLSKLWDDFHDRKSSIDGLIENGDELGVAFGGTKPGYYRYFGGAQASGNVSFKEFSTWELEKGEYIICSFEGENFEQLVTDALYKAQRYLFEMWLVKHKIIYKPFAVERYANHTPETTCMEIWVMLE
ncbi:AraC family transcriptional regulator [Candidatus Galacturonibacter soehngenii]|uniref:AraC family transcriptional regulator n=1 Tax=Candidatus Galacturonatibacter soehngenii TaxID=2307010 RepID=A0A7V7QJB1_9FIRM|nr:helix-turn-helix domain-containing protein [Candidatus Galacturonibacter soehngenii]KAB1437541.1 AraC family transcriptional regulator [Candidatus Galacturonibacter soehngenii]